MLETYFDMILFPIKEILKLYIDPRLTDFLGVSLMSAIVTGVLMLLVFKALINPSGISRINDKDIANINKPKSKPYIVVFKSGEKDG